MISVSSADFLLIYDNQVDDGNDNDHINRDDRVVHDHVANDDIFSFVENTFGVITATRSLLF